MTRPEILDAEGTRIQLGSVLRNVVDGETGVVIGIVRIGDSQSAPIMSQDGDLHIFISAGMSRVTNKYHEWTHVPHDQQTYMQRLLSWKQIPYDHKNRIIEEQSFGVGLAIDGIMSLMPHSIRESDDFSYPETIEEVLGLLAVHLESTQLRSKVEK